MRVLTTTMRGSSGGSSLRSSAGLFENRPGSRDWPGGPRVRIPPPPAESQQRTVRCLQPRLYSRRRRLQLLNISPAHMTFSFFFLRRIETARAAGLGGLDRLAIDDARRWARLASGRFASLQQELEIDPLQYAAV